MRPDDISKPSDIRKDNVSKDDIRKLIGGYATGTLTEDQRKLLFEAALEDQDLFEELAREQVLEETLARPGVRQRLIAAVQKPEAGLFTRHQTNAWIWGAVATLAVALALAVWLPRRQPPPVEVAVLTQRADVPLPPPAPESAPRPAPRNEPPTAARQAANEPAQGQSQPALEDRLSQQKASSLSPAESGNQAAPQTAPPAESVKAESVKEEAAAKVAETRAPASPPAAAGGAAGAAPAPLVAAARAPQAQPPPPVAQAPATFSARVAGAQPRFAFDYALGTDGRLTITPRSDGYLRVTATATGANRVVLPATGTGAVVNGSATVVNLPQGTTQVEITLSRLAGAAASAGAIAQNRDQATPSSNAASGTVEDPSPSPGSTISIAIRVPPTP